MNNSKVSYLFILFFIILILIFFIYLIFIIMYNNAKQIFIITVTLLIGS